MIVFNFNVVARPGGEFGARVPDPQGTYLWRTMHEATVGRMGIVVNEEVEESLLETWLKLNGVKAVMYEVLGSSEPDYCADKVARILGSSGGKHPMYFDTDPATVAKTLALGICSLVFTQPHTIRPEWSTTKQQRRSWDLLTEEIDKQRIAKAEKSWREIDWEV